MIGAVDGWRAGALRFGLLFAFMYFAWFVSVCDFVVFVRLPGSAVGTSGSGSLRCICQCMGMVGVRALPAPRRTAERASARSPRGQHRLASSEPHAEARSGVCCGAGSAGTPPRPIHWHSNKSEAVPTGRAFCSIFSSASIFRRFVSVLYSFFIFSRVH